MGGIRSSKRSKSSQLGFTMVELVVAVAISAVILVGIGAGLRAILVSSANSTNHSLAMSEVQKVASWIGDDVVQAQNVSLGDYSNGGFPLIISWTRPQPGNVTYGNKTVTDKLGRNLWELYRTTSSGTAMVAQHLKPFDPTDPLGTTSCSPLRLGNGTLENVLVMNVASQVDAYRASASYQISPRAFDFTWGALIYTLTYTAGANGFLLPLGNTAQTVIPGGDGREVTAYPDNSTYFFVRWSDGVLTPSRTDTNVTHNISVTAVFGSNTYTITASAGSGGNITPSGAVVVNYGGNKAFTIAANAGYCITVTVDGNSQGAIGNYTFTNVTADHTIAATFIKPTISASAGAGGSILPSGNVSVNCGENQAFTITPNAHYHVADVLVDGSSVGNVTSYPFTNLTYNHTIAATFAIDTYTISASAGSGGSISPSGAVVVNYGGNKTFTITANTGYHITNVVVDSVSQGAIGNYTFINVNGNHAIAASFAINTYTVTPSAGTGGNLTPSTPQTVNYGNTTSFTVTANTGYYIVSVTGCGGTLVGNTYTTGPITGNCTVAATFANTYTITASAGSGGSISPSGAVVVNYGGSQTFAINANSGYCISGVLVDGGSVGKVSSYTFSNVTVTHTIAATFASYSNTGSNVPSLSAAGTFTSPDNAFSSNNVYATASNGQSESYANFRSTFTIPSGAIIKGIEVRVEAQKSGGSVSNFDVSLSWDGGGSFTSTKKTTPDFGSSDSTKFVGSATDTWGRTTWSPGDFSDANFRVRLYANCDAGKTIKLDCVQVIVYYCP